MEDSRSEWPIGGGESGDLIRAFDWSATSLGPIESWPRHLRATVDTIVNSPIPKVLMWGPDHVMIYNDGYIEIAGGNHPRALGGTVPHIWPEIWDWNRRIIETGFRGEVNAYRDQPMTLLRNGGPETVTFDLFYTPIHLADGSVGGVLCTVLDTTRRVRMEDQLRSSNKRFRAAIDVTNGTLWTNGADGKMRGEQPGWAALTGQTHGEYQGYGWADVVHPDDAAPTIAAWERSVASRTTFHFEHRLRRHDGQWRHYSVHAIPIIDETGALEEWVGVHTDITERMAFEDAILNHAQDLQRQVRHRERAEEQLRALNETLEARVASALEERRLAEAALAQSQKLETIGKLTGGVAHDFNNLLQVVSGNLQLLAKDIAGNETAERRVANAMAGVARGSKLASQLLAFGRRQALEPKVVNVTRFVRGMDDMLRRAIGEAVEVEIIATAGLWNTFIDPTQIENAVLNLAINARDAMEGQGKLTIELGNSTLDDDYARSHAEVTPGQYVMLAVSDTGCGMSAALIEQVFEPFFSTKPEGKGSGLGLSMVYGFVKQSGGHVKIYSEEGYGTTVRLYLPRAMEAEDVEVVTLNQPVTGGTETVLVVEDDEDVRDTVVALLTDLGYRVLKAVDAQSGLNVIDSGMPIDLLFTDVVMPGTLKSPELARKAKERLPNIAVLFTSGYTENSIVHGGRLDVGVELLSKPYTREALARKVRHVLGNEAQRRQIREPSEAAPVIAEASGTTVLLVEDDPLIRMSTAEMLRDAGLTVIEAPDAEKAMDLETEVEVLITDLNLPGRSGLELAQVLRERLPHLRVLLTTGESDVKAEGVEVIEKPYDIDHLLASVRQIA